MSGTLLSEYNEMQLAAELLQRCLIEQEANGPNGAVKQLELALKNYLGHNLPVRIQVQEPPLVCERCGKEAELLLDRICQQCVEFTVL